MNYLFTTLLLIASLNVFTQNTVKCYGIAESFDAHLNVVQSKMESIPPEWDQGLKFQENVLNKSTGSYSFEISKGFYYKMHRENVEPMVVSVKIDLKSILYDEQTLIVYMNKGKITASFSGIRLANKKDVMIIYKINFIIAESKIVNVDVVDYRGFKIGRTVGFGIDGSVKH